MARILIRPDELGRLARRFDAAADDLIRAGRRLARTRAEVRLNPADDTFPAARVAERAALVEADLRRLAAEFRVDAGLMARTVDDAELEGPELDDAARWTVGLITGVRRGAAPVAPGVGSLNSVVAGLLSVGARTTPAGEAISAEGRTIGSGGLFARSFTGGGQEMLVRLTERLEASSVPGDPRVDPGGATAGAVWTRIVGELFEAGDDP